MDPDELPDPQVLWWSAVSLAALHRAGGRGECRFEAEPMVVRLDEPGRGWLRLQRCRGGRFVLWGRSPLAPVAPRDARRDAPDWALTPATDDGRPTFVAWFAHDEWDLTDDQDDGLARLLRPWTSVDADLAHAAQRGELHAEHLRTDAVDEEALAAALALAREAGGPAPAPSRGPLPVRLREQVHDQMREAAEADRMLLQQPPEVVAWARVHAPRGPFEHAVMVRRDEAVPAVTNTALSRTARATLANVLRDLRRKEAGEEHGAWLFARVSSDGRLVRFDRAFDHWPSWWRVARPAQGPALDDLAWEMAQRSPAWRPGWASLLRLPAGRAPGPA